jgi:hypothetical protein
MRSAVAKRTEKRLPVSAGHHEIDDHAGDKRRIVMKEIQRVDRACRIHRDIAGTREKLDDAASTSVIVVDYEHGAACPASLSCHRSIG